MTRMTRKSNLGGQSDCNRDNELHNMLRYAAMHCDATRCYEYMLKGNSYILPRYLPIDAQTCTILYDYNVATAALHKPHLGPLGGESSSLQLLGDPQMSKSTVYTSTNIYSTYSTMWMDGEWTVSWTTHCSRHVVLVWVNMDQQWPTYINMIKNALGFAFHGPLFPCAECPPCASNALLALPDCCPVFGEQELTWT